MHKDSSYVAKGRDSLFTGSGIARTTYEREVENYKRDLDTWKAFNLKIIDRLDELQKARALQKDSSKSLKKL